MCQIFINSYKKNMTILKDITIPSSIFIIIILFYFIFFILYSFLILGELTNFLVF
jgi:hypothetical protein